MTSVMMSLTLLSGLHHSTQTPSPPQANKIFLPKPIWDALSESNKHLIIDQNRKIRVFNAASNPRPTSIHQKSVIGTKPDVNYQVCIHEQDAPSKPPDPAPSNDIPPADPLPAMVHVTQKDSPNSSDSTQLLSPDKTIFPSPLPTELPRYINSMLMPGPIKQLLSLWTGEPMVVLQDQTYMSSIKLIARSMLLGSMVMNSQD